MSWSKNAIHHFLECCWCDEMNSFNGEVDNIIFYPRQNLKHHSSDSHKSIFPYFFSRNNDNPQWFPFTTQFLKLFYFLFAHWLHGLTTASRREIIFSLITCEPIRHGYINLHRTLYEMPRTNRTQIYSFDND